MAQISDPGGDGAPSTLQAEAAELAKTISEVAAKSGRSWVAVVTDASFQASNGLVYATIGSSEVQVIAWSTQLAAGDRIIVKKFDNSQNSPYLLEEFAADSEIDANAVEYALCFADPGTGPSGSVLCHWGGRIRAIFTEGTATFGLSVGGTGVGVGDTIANDSWLVVTVSDGEGTYASIAVIVG